MTFVRALLSYSVCTFIIIFGFFPKAGAADAPSVPVLNAAPPLATPVPTVNSGDNAWLLISSALVLMMTAPGLILFYGGLVRRKNVLSTMMHSLILMGVISL